ncbi:hypothetical protein JHJ32_10660 [Parapedobacter sp. ISTM3]|uniref:Uncharacterized protein n=1 Tax=Parapedobacter luteus TaxID=623280 RepID=A0A1T5B1W5_9SPHI|nr:MULTISPECIES: hypothetical protein [Parapedobacter]MBK1440447.1 hypothetical protein [Parapedobacter sp. ISTM3]SKB41222.1 hypothetical protein SAMN05660226_01272 [Parapedobacter luteus]
MEKLFKSKMRFVLIPIMAAAFVILVGYLVMMLWNYTLPALLGVNTITFWQAVALFFLCKILFGFGGDGAKGGRGRWKKKDDHGAFSPMTEADKSRFGAYMRWKACGWKHEADEQEQKGDV